MTIDLPISDSDLFDVVGSRKDGGIDLVVSCKGPLDGSIATLAALEKKIRNYIYEVRNAKSPTFFERYNRAPNAKVSIFVSCPFPIDPKAYDVIDRMRPIAEQIGASIEVTTTME